MKNLFKFLGITVLAAVVGFAMAACSNPAGGPPSGPPTFVADTGIDSVPTGCVIGTEVNLGTAVVHPAEATNQTIVWSVKSDGGTGVTTAGIVGSKFTPTAAGTLVLTATIANGLAEGTDYVSGDFTINVSATFKAVTDISFTGITGVTGLSGSTANAVVGTDNIDLSSAAVTPADATNTVIEWSVKSAGGTGASIAANKVTTTAGGTLVLTATVTNGTAQGTDKTKDLTITVINPVTGISFSGVTGITDDSGATGTQTNSGTTSTAYGIVGTEIDLTSAVGTPAAATNKTIVWTGPDVSGGKVTPNAKGTLELTATITNGSAVGTNYVHTLTVTVIRPVASIADVPNTGTAGSELDLHPTVNPTSDASFTAANIQWEVTNAGTTGITTADIVNNKIDGSKVGVGTLKLKATIPNGSGMGHDFVKDDFDDIVISS